MTQKTNQDEIEQYMASMPKIYQKTYQRAMTSKSLRAAINAKCLDCSNFQRP